MPFFTCWRSRPIDGLRGSPKSRNMPRRSVGSLLAMDVHSSITLRRLSRSVPGSTHDPANPVTKIRAALLSHPFTLLVFLGRILQKVCHRAQDLARKCLIRYGACQGHSPDERTESQNRSRSRRTFIFGWTQSANQLNVVPDLFGGKRTGPLIAACDFWRQRAEGTAGARII